jgi:Flp pilus assembly protein TadG
MVGEEGVSPLRGRCFLRRGRREAQTGTALVEFILTIPVLLLTLTGALDLGRAYHYQVLVSDAARIGARTMIGTAIPLGTTSTGPGFNAICSAVRGDLSAVQSVTCTQVNHAAPYTAGVDYTPPTASTAVALIYCGGVAIQCDIATGGHPVHLTGEVDVYYGFATVTPILSWLGSSSVIVMSSRAQGLTNW